MSIRVKVTPKFSRYAALTAAEAYGLIVEKPMPEGPEKPQPFFGSLDRRYLSALRQHAEIAEVEEIKA